MARHADPDPSSFYRSLATAALRGLVALVVVAALTVVVSLVNRQDDGDPTVALEAQPTTGDLEAQPTTGDLEAQPTTDAPAPADTTVQVIDGVGDPARTEHAVSVLRELGYEVVAVNPSAVDYDITSILFSQGRQPHAEALRERDGRFAQIGANANLSEAVDLHVVVGRDFPR